LDGTRDVDGRATADQVRMGQDVATMFEDLRAMADRYAELHADRVQLEAELEHARQDADRQRADHTAELERVRDELVRARQDAGLWREEIDRERARITNMQADADRAGDGAAAVMAKAIGSQAIDPSGQLSAHPGISWR
jgi:chromosome segregation ATPase